jgi:hypothetical protein
MEAAETSDRVITRRVVGNGIWFRHGSNRLDIYQDECEHSEQSGLTYLNINLTALKENFILQGENRTEHRPGVGGWDRD